MAGPLKGMLLNVSGVVQGVGFRWYVKRVADRFGVKGYVRNQYDGSVEVYGEGDDTSLRALYDEIKVGPRYADVAAVNVEWLEYQGKFNDFRIVL